MLATTLALAAALAPAPASASAAPPSAPVAAVAGFHALVIRRPSEACRRYLTSAGRRQWESFESIPCRWRTTNIDPEDEDERTFRLVARKGRVARVEDSLVDSPVCGPYGNRWVHTVVRRDGAWRIAKFGELECTEVEPEPETPAGPS
ncbi:MAG TPA: hypothetical protein VN238_02795 [Solirubrobacteraceae bacterium]|nr:hypothetical protein [Solirubrobacteraceae bacterium]